MAITTHDQDTSAALVSTIQRALQRRDVASAYTAFLQLPSLSTTHKTHLDDVLRDAYKAGMFHIHTAIAFLEKLPNPEWTLDGCCVIHSVHEELSLSSMHIVHVPVLPLADFIHKLMLHLDHGDLQRRAQRYWFQWISPTLRAIATGKPVRIESYHRREVMYAPANDLTFDRSRRHVFTWQREWSTDERKDHWRFVAATPQRDRFLIQGLQFHEYLYAADYAKLRSGTRGKQRSRVFSWRRTSEDVGEMGHWQLVRVDPLNREVFALYNPYQNEYLFAGSDQHDSERRFVVTAAAALDPDAEWLRLRQWRITPLAGSGSSVEKAIEAFFTKSYQATVDLCTQALTLEPLSDRTQQLKCYVYRMAANLRLGNVEAIDGDVAAVEQLGGHKAAMFHGLHDLWTEAAALVAQKSLSREQKLTLLPIEIQLQRGDQLFVAQDYDGALEIYKECVSDEDKTVKRRKTETETGMGTEQRQTDALLQIAKCLYAKSQPGSALEALERVLQCHEESKTTTTKPPLSVTTQTHVLLWMGRCKRQQKRYDEALSMLERAFDVAAMAEAQWLRQSIALEMQVVGICQREMLDKLLLPQTEAIASKDPSSVQNPPAPVVEMLQAMQCPLSLELMVDPVVSPHGTTYERSMIEHHLDVNGAFDPLTRAALDKTQLVPNRALRMLMDTLLRDHKLGQLLRVCAA